MIGSGPARYASWSGRGADRDQATARGARHRTEQDLDLVEVADKANPPVCRIMDYGKYKYEAAQRAKESRKKSSSASVKEMKYRPKIGPGDFDTKTRKVVHFLEEGHKVKITLMFRGREMPHPELGRKILDRVVEATCRRRPGRDQRPPGRSQDDHGPRTRQEGPGGGQGPSEEGAEQRCRTPPSQRRRHPRRQLRPSTPDRRAPRPTGPNHEGNVMPKMKTHRASAKRFKVTGSGKVTRRQANRNHILEKKSRQAAAPPPG